MLQGDVSRCLEMERARRKQQADELKISPTTPTPTLASQFDSLFSVPEDQEVFCPAVHGAAMMTNDDDPNSPAESKIGGTWIARIAPFVPAEMVARIEALGENYAESDLLNILDELSSDQLLAVARSIEMGQVEQFGEAGENGGEEGGGEKFGAAENGIDEDAHEVEASRDLNPSCEGRDKGRVEVPRGSTSPSHQMQKVSSISANDFSAQHASPLASPLASPEEEKEDHWLNQFEFPQNQFQEYLRTKETGEAPGCPSYCEKMLKEFPNTAEGKDEYLNFIYHEAMRMAQDSLKDQDLDPNMTKLKKKILSEMGETLCQTSHDFHTYVETLVTEKRHILLKELGLGQNDLRQLNTGSAERPEKSIFISAKKNSLDLKKRITLATRTSVDLRKTADAAHAKVAENTRNLLLKSFIEAGSFVPDDHEVLKSMAEALASGAFRSQIPQTSERRRDNRPPSPEELTEIQRKADQKRFFGTYSTPAHTPPFRGDSDKPSRFTVSPAIPEGDNNSHNHNFTTSTTVHTYGPGLSQNTRSHPVSSEESVDRIQRDGDIDSTCQRDQIDILDAVDRVPEREQPSVPVRDETKNRRFFSIDFFNFLNFLKENFFSSEGVSANFRYIRRKWRRGTLSADVCENLRNFPGAACHLIKEWLQNSSADSDGENPSKNSKFSCGFYFGSVVFILFVISLVLSNITLFSNISQQSNSQSPSINANVNATGMGSTGSNPIAVPGQKNQNQNQAWDGPDRTASGNFLNQNVGTMYTERSCSDPAASHQLQSERPEMGDGHGINTSETGIDKFLSEQTHEKIQNEEVAPKTSHQSSTLLLIPKLILLGILLFFLFLFLARDDYLGAYLHNLVQGSDCLQCILGCNRHNRHGHTSPDSLAHSCCCGSCGTHPASDWVLWCYIVNSVVVMLSWMLCCWCCWKKCRKTDWEEFRRNVQIGKRLGEDLQNMYQNHPASTETPIGV